MHEAFSSGPAETTPMEEPGAATGEGQDEAQCLVEREQENFEREGKVDYNAGDMTAGRLWADQMTYVEEEPWTEDLHATWPDYPPGV